MISLTLALLLSAAAGMQINEVVEVVTDLSDPAEINMEMESDEDVVLEIPSGYTELDPETDTISVDFPDEDIRRIIRNVADLYGLNVIIPDTLNGRTSIKLRNVYWIDIFDAVLEPTGFTYDIVGKQNSIIKIRDEREAIRARKMATMSPKIVRSLMLSLILSVILNVIVLIVLTRLSLLIIKKQRPKIDYPDSKILYGPGFYLFVAVTSLSLGSYVFCRSDMSSLYLLISAGIGCGVYFGIRYFGKLPRIAIRMLVLITCITAVALPAWIVYSGSGGYLSRLVVTACFILFPLSVLVYLFREHVAGWIEADAD